MTTTTTQTLLDTTRALAEDIERDRVDVTVAVYDASALPGVPGDGSTVAVYMTARVLMDCTRCGEPLPVGAPGPYTWYDQGGIRGSHSQQHGCGEWNAPEEVGTEIGEDADPTGELGALLAELDEAVTQSQDREAEAARLRLMESILDARVALAAGEDEEDVLTGSETNPGVWRGDDGRLTAWDWDPTGRDPEGIVVAEDGQ